MKEKQTKVSFELYYAGEYKKYVVIKVKAKCKGKKVIFV